MTRALFGRVWTASALKLMSYRADFWTTLLASFAVDIVIVYSLWQAVFAATSSTTVGGFTLRGMVVYYVVTLLLAKIVSGAERDYSVAEDIYQGALTRYLLYPAPYFGFKYAEHLGTLVPAFLQLFVFGGVALGLFGAPSEMHVTPATIAMALVAVAVANLLHFLLLFPLQSVAFWADNIWSLHVMFRFTANMLGGVALPLSLFPEWARAITAVLPFEYLYYFPAMTLMGRVSVQEWLRGMAVSIGWCVVVGVAARAVWRRGTRSYTGVGI